ncbi:gas vesicle protein K [Trebonia kvetii]|uniref:Gas vesicle protein K n=1 Tax=Trebonia kvetii TaxID=2480626 RepID=A0A6P2BP62_9ACTN|nr:gas vesicle protein K [Trebonia kvetii]TVZ00740.1 gas vesicle protein K [Trebonia kvetii]
MSREVGRVVSEAGRAPSGQRVRYRLDGDDPEAAERGLAALVLTIVELLRQLMERQALRRVEDGTVSDEQAERLGTTLMRLDEAMNELTERFGIERRELNIDLGPLGPLLDS